MTLVQVLFFFFSFFFYKIIKHKTGQLGYCFLHKYGYTEFLLGETKVPFVLHEKKSLLWDKKEILAEFLDHTS